MSFHKQPLTEVFGHLITDHTEKAIRYRSHRLCPFNNKVPSCTKDKAKNPLGVCSIYHGDQPVITCPVRFREDWIIADDAASFFFGKSATWSSLVEVRLNDANGRSAGNIDVVLVAYDEHGKVYDFGALQIQSVYISGNISEPREYYMEDPKMRDQMVWQQGADYPQPDYLLSQKKLISELLLKGGILHSHQKKIAIILDKYLFETLPSLIPVSQKDADIVWLIYDLQMISARGNEHSRFTLKKVNEIFTKFQSDSLSRIC